MKANFLLTAFRSGAPSLSSGRRRLGHVVPIALFALLALILGRALTQNPRNIPSALIGSPVPQFTLPPVKGRMLGLASADLTGEVSVVNVFASWCVVCREEHPVLMQMNAKFDIAVHGLNHKDQPDNAARWLNIMGDPYTRTGADIAGRVAIDWGVYGVPETFVVIKDGRIAYRHIGAVTPQDMEKAILPLMRRLQQQ